jgi:hypothetical protein
MNVELTVYVEIGEDEHEFTCEVGYTPGTPGKTWGPPENCYPPEPPEIEYGDFVCKEAGVTLSPDEFEVLQNLGDPCPHLKGKPWTVDELDDDVRDLVASQADDEPPWVDDEPDYYDDPRDDYIYERD